MCQYKSNLRSITSNGGDAIRCRLQFQARELPATGQMKSWRRIETLWAQYLFNLVNIFQSNGVQVRPTNPIAILEPTLAEKSKNNGRAAAAKNYSNEMGSKICHSETGRAGQCWFGAACSSFIISDSMTTATRGWSLDDIEACRQNASCLRDTEHCLCWLKNH